PALLGARPVRPEPGTLGWIPHRARRAAGPPWRGLWAPAPLHGDRDAAWAPGPHCRARATRLAPIDLALVPIGAYEPRWFMRDIHMNPAEAVQAHLDLGAAPSLALHFGP